MSIIAYFYSALIIVGVDFSLKIIKVYTRHDIY